MHRFPNPEKYLERFKIWVTIAGGNPESVADYEYFQKKRLCDRHFTDKDRIRFNRLNALAVPSLHVTGKLSNHVIQAFYLGLAFIFLFKPVVASNNHSNL